MKKRFILITGAVRSGKSAYALKLGEKEGERRVYLATAEALDSEMAERIAEHRRRRPKAWCAVEEPLALSQTLAHLDGWCDVVVVDCLTLWLSNLLQRGAEREEELTNRVIELVGAIRKVRCSVFVVSNEVGWGVVPEAAVARLFRDVVGRAHQMLAEAADEVYIMMAGLPLRLKP